MLNSPNHSEMLCDATMPGPLWAQQLMLMLMTRGCYWRPIESLAGIGDQTRGCWAPDLLRRQRDGIRFIRSFNRTITPHAWPCRNSLSRSMHFTAGWCIGLIGLEELAVVACTCRSKVFRWPFLVHASCLPVVSPLLILGRRGRDSCFIILSSFIVSSIFLCQVVTIAVAFDMYICILNWQWSAGCIQFSVAIRAQDRAVSMAIESG